jgi:hypothetical protein
VYAGCRECKIRNCAIDKGVAHCVDCGAFPCKTYLHWTSAAKLLPHVREAVASLDAIRSQGAERWAFDQEQRWSCPNCKERVSWYASTCVGCGKSLSKITYTMTGLRRLICRFLLPRLYRKGRDRSVNPKAT